MNRLWYVINDQLVGGESVVVATLFGKSGSAPRTDGAKMIIHADGSIAGTIGGGKLESAVQGLASQVFKSKTPLIFPFELTAFEVAENDMICGGKGEILIEYLDALNPVNLAIYHDIAAALKRRERAWLLTEFGAERLDGEVSRCLIKSDGTVIGHLECNYQGLYELVSATDRVSIHSGVLDNQRLLIEPIRDTGSLYIFGAGHVARQLAVLAEMVNFKTIVMDDRTEFACQERFPRSDIVLLESFDEIPANLQLGRDSFVVIVTRGHVHDKNVLGQVLKLPCAYIGMIASKRKRNLVYKALQEERGFNDNDFARVHSPIGIDILAETPEEIAVSIVAELIKVRAER